MRQHRLRIDMLVFLVGLTVLISILPIVSIWEVATTGTIDMDAVGKGRGSYPTWFLYLLSWICFFYAAPALILCLNFCLKFRVMTMQKNELRLGNFAIQREHVVKVRRSYSGFIIDTTHTKIRVFPWMFVDGRAAFDRWLQRLPTASDHRAG